MCVDKLPKAQKQMYNQKKHNSNQIFYPNQNNSLYPYQRPSFSNQQQVSNNNLENTQSLDTDLLIARLGALGGIIQTIGGFISTSASLLALQELQNDLKSQSSAPNATLRGSGTVLTGNDPTNNSTTSTTSTTSSSINNHSTARINELEKQVEYLMKELNSLKNSNKKKKI